LGRANVTYADEREVAMKAIQHVYRLGQTSWICLVIAGVVAALLLAGSLGFTTAQEPLAEPPQGQTYIGSRECASCHFDQFMSWRTTPHAKGFDILPEKYRADANCLKCHTTGHGEAAGFTSLAATPNLVGTSCEACHGPGSKHAEIAKSFGQTRLTDQQSAYVRSTIHRMQPKNVCVECHLAQSHKQHPQFDK
jgi:hypothetical protein